MKKQTDIEKQIEKLEKEYDNAQSPRDVQIRVEIAKLRKKLEKKKRKGVLLNLNVKLLSSVDRLAKSCKISRNEFISQILEQIVETAGALK
jgi:hypothetical protein